MFKVTVQAEFCASHQIPGYPGKCANLHGHNFVIEVSLYKTRLNKIGLAIDFSEFKENLIAITDSLDHTHLNDLPYFKKHAPSCEYVAKYIYKKMKKSYNKYKVAVKVWESPRNSITYTE